jgi:hypothetical protein
MRFAVSFAAVAAFSLALSAVVPQSAVAQDASKAPSFGSVRLSAGFTPDPHTVRVVAGGSIDAYNDTPLPGACVGKIADAPDYRVTYTSGSFPLVFRTVASQDTTLVINGPDGQWSCDDDSYGDGDAQVVYRRPQSGVYDVWVGTFGSNPVTATLQITETP